MRLLACAATLIAGLLLAPAPEPSARLYLLDETVLHAARAAIAGRDAAVTSAWDRLRADAEHALTAARFSVVDKPVAPPSGDKHDYLSQAPYFWPDPSRPGGRPYVRRDGVRNPEIERITDHRAVDGLVGTTRTLALAYYFSGDERYAAKAASLLRAFFLDPATRMNPHLDYAQFIPGVNDGRGIGLIETRALTRVVDSVGLIAGSTAWRSDDDRGIREWFAAFLEWMQESRNGRDESAAKNNHGSFYDVQIAAYALFLDRRAVAADVVGRALDRRIAVQIEPDGRQPLELARTNAWGYSVMNLDGLTELAVLGDRAGVDLWHAATPGGASIRRAILFLAPYALGEKPWGFAQISGFNGAALFPIIRRAAAHYQDAEFQALVKRLPAVAPGDRQWLTGDGV